MQNRTLEEGGDILTADLFVNEGQYDFESDGCGQRPAMHIVGGGERFGLGLHVYEIKSNLKKYLCNCINFYIRNAFPCYSNNSRINIQIECIITIIKIIEQKLFISNLTVTI